MLELCTNHIRAIRLHAESTYPNECCGLLLGVKPDNRVSTKILIEVRGTDNAWSSEQTEFGSDDSSLGDRRYAIAPETLLATQRETRDRALAIIGVYHSHPDHPATPSEFDQEFAWPEYSYMIVSVQNGRLKDLQCWMLDNDHNFQPEAIVVTEPTSR